MLHIKTNDAVLTLKKLGIKLSIKELALAQSRAINHSLSKGRTKARSEVKRVYNISQKYVQGIDIKKATPTRLEGNIHADRKPIPLDAFAPKQETASSTITITKRGQQKIRTLKRARKSPTGGVSIEVVRGNRETVPFAFLIAGGAARVFARGEYRHGTAHGFIQRHQRVSKDGSDIPVKPLITLSVFGSVINDKVINHIGSAVKSDYAQRIDHEIKFIAQQAGG